MYNKEGKFPGPIVIPRRRPWTLLNFLFWASLLLSPLIKFAYGVAISGSPLLIIGFIIFLVIGRQPVHCHFNVAALADHGSGCLPPLFCCLFSFYSHPTPHWGH